MKKKHTLLIYLVLSYSSLFSQEKNSVWEESLKDLSEIDIPIRLGEDKFRERVKKRGEAHGRKEPLGLVLSGGAARALAHIGVLKQLEAHDIFVDFIVSNSMGSLVGMLYAAGFSPDDIHAIMLKVAEGSYFKFEIPFSGGLINQELFLSFINTLVDGLQIENTSIPIAVIAEDLKSRRKVIFSEGDFASILGASIALPIGFEPVIYKDFVLIDGGALNLVPIGEAYEYSSQVLASTSFYNTEQNLKNIFVILNKTIDQGKSRAAINEIKTYTPTLIQPDVTKINYMAFSQVDNFIALGEEAVTQVLPSLAVYQAPLKEIDKQWKEEQQQQQVNLNRFIKQLRVTESPFSPSIYPPYSTYQTNGGFQTNFRFYGGLPNDYYLNNMNMISLDGFLNLGNFFLRSNFFLGSVAEETISKDFNQTKEWSTHNGLGTDIFYSSQWLSAQASALYSLPQINENKTDDFSWKYITFRGHLLQESWGNASLFTTFEHRIFADSSSTLFHRIGADFYKNKNLGIQGSFYHFDEGYGYTIQNKIYKKIHPLFAIENQSLWRNSIAKKNHTAELTPLFQSDIYRGTKKEIQESDQVFSINNTIFLTPATETYLGEILTVKNYEIGAFYDYHFLDESSYSVGGIFQVELSFVGLSSFLFYISGGYDESTDSSFFELSLGNKL